MRYGLTLLELVLVLAVAGVLLATGVPRLSGYLDRLEVGAAAGHIAAAHQRARLMAITRSQVLILSIDSAALTIRRRESQAPIWSESGPASSGVSLTGPTRTFLFSPEGFTLGLSNATLRLNRGAATRAVVGSRLGRVRITR
jgi:prepilin-type N-terminal cleavage/methylation domain-containing protein